MRLRSLVLLALVTACFDPEGGTGEGGSTDSSTTMGATMSGTSTASTTTSDPTTTEGTMQPTTEDPTGSTSIDPETTSSSTTASEGVCGDGQRDPGEACDDGTNAGQTEGDCAPDCSAVVQRKLIRLSQNATPADFAPGRDPVAVADSFCPNGFLAFFADGINRVASVGPLMGNGQVDWVLQPWTEYVNPAGDRMWTTTEVLLLGVGDDNTWVGLESPLVPDVNFSWSGMLGDYTTSTLTCTGWSDTAGILGSAGQVHQTAATFVGPPDNDSGGICSVSHEFMCVEQ